MNNKRATKRALLTSVMALVMCVVMLVGTTFAWFTDTASTGVNKIQAGNLDIELAYKNAYMPTEVPATDGGFAAVTENTKVFNESALWEPGHVEYVVLKIRNAGTLALKYKLGINIAEEKGSKSVVDNKDFKLSDYIKFAVIDGDKDGLGRDVLVAEAGAGTELSKGYTPTEEHLLKGENKIVTLVVWMPKSVGNEANYDATVAGAPVINLGINVVATQDTVERDSFDETYDKNAQYPEVSYAQVSSQEDLNAALKSPTDANGNPTKKVAVELKNAGTYELPAMTGKDVTIIGTKDTVIDMKDKLNNNATNVSFEGVTVNFGTQDYKGFQHTGKLTYKDCTITGKQFLYGTEVEFIDCTFVQDAVDYNVWTYGAGSVLFKDCTFDCKGKAVLIYNEGHISSQNVEFQNCKFNASAKATGKAAIEIDCRFTSYNVVIDKATANNVSGFDNGSKSGSTVWNVKDGSKATTVTIDGTKVKATPHKLQSFRLAEVYQHILWITSAVLPAKVH